MLLTFNFHFSVFWYTSCVISFSMNFYDVIAAMEHPLDKRSLHGSPCVLTVGEQSNMFSTSTSFMVSLEECFIFLKTLMDFQLLMFIKGLLTTFKIAYMLFSLIFMFAFKLFLQV